MLYQVAYCDDDFRMGKIFAEKIKAAFASRELPVNLAFFQSPLRLLESISGGNSYDILFLDVDMPELDGIALGKRIQAVGFSPAIVFLSSKAEQVYRSLQVRPVRFIRKSHFAAEIDDVIQAAVQYVRSASRHSVILCTDRKVYHINVKDLMYLEVNNKSLTFHLREEDFTIKYKLSDAMTSLESHGFIQTHKSYAVNYRYIFSIEGNNVILTDKQRIPVSRHRSAEVFQQFLDLTHKEIHAKEEAYG